MTSWHMKRCLEEISLLRLKPSILRKYASMCSLARAWSSCDPMVLRSLHSASTSSSSGFSSGNSLTTHVCMMRSVSICFLKSSPMKRMFPSIRRRATSIASARCWSFLRSSSSSSSFVLGLGGTSPSSSGFSLSSAASFGASSPAATRALSSAASLIAFSASLMAPSPFSNSSWHRINRTRLNVITFGFSGSSLAGSLNSTPSARNRSESCWHIAAYSSANVGSVSALSKSCAMSPMSVCASPMPSSKTFSKSFSKFCGVSLFKMLLNALCFLSSSSIFDLSIATNLFSIC